MQNQNQSTAEARLRTLVESDDESTPHSELASERTTPAGYAVDLIFPTEDRPNNSTPTLE